MIKLPGLIDVHVHLREPGATHKEDWDSGTAAALAGGITMVLGMPNTQPPIFDQDTLEMALSAAGSKARCDYAQFIGAGPENAAGAAGMAPKVAGLKMYLDMTYGQLRLDDMTLWQSHFIHWPVSYPIVVHSEGRTMAAAILFASIYDRSIHIAHVASREEILTIKAAKEHGVKVTCEVAPHHLFLCTDDYPRLSKNDKFPGRQEVRPRLASPDDRQALWDNLDVIDCFATDHAPHTLSEKDSDNPPPGFPGLETALPLLLSAVQEGRLTFEDIISRMNEAPRRIFNLPEQPDTWVEIDPTVEYIIRGTESFSRCGWTPFEGWVVRGRVERVILRGQTAYENGKILAKPGNGKNIRNLS
jgi:carbamoyl-phosphate synthase/aspartate carbamoyltransferase/dihydroorotase